MQDEEPALCRSHSRDRDVCRIFHLPFFQLAMARRARLPMFTSRHFYLRLILAGLGMLSICAGIYLVVGWAVWSRQKWLIRWIGEERRQQWYTAYAQMASTLDAGDSDGDGASDG